MASPPGPAPARGPEVDDAKALFEDKPADAIELDEACERRLLRKIDLLLIPLMFVSYGLQYYDKAVMGSASVAGLLTDLDLIVTIPPPPGSPAGTQPVQSINRFSWATALFYFGALSGVYPSAWLAQRLPIAKFLAVMVALWSSIVLLTTACTSYQGLYANRFFLGLVESCSSPIFLLITGMWYKKNEAVLRIAIWYAATGVCACFASLLNYAIGHIDGPLSPWKYMYLVAGSFTMLWAVLIWIVLPDSPSRPSRWLSLEERRLAVLRIRGNLTGIENKHFKLHQLLEGLGDVQIWLHSLMIVCIYVCNGGVTSFGSIIIHGFGYSSLDSILLFSPAGPCTVISIAFFSGLAYLIPNSRTYLIPLSCLPVLAGAAIVWKGAWENRAVPLAGIYLVASFGGPMVLVLSLAASNVAGHTKKAFSAGCSFAAYNIGNIIAPYTIRLSEQDAHFRSAWLAIIICMAATCVLSLVLRLVLVRRNAAKLDTTPQDRIEASPEPMTGKGTAEGEKESEVKVTGAAESSASSTRQSPPAAVGESRSRRALDTALDDLTDRENPFFTYTL